MKEKMLTEIVKKKKKMLRKGVRGSDKEEVARCIKTS